MTKNESYSFIKFPKAFINNEFFKNISIESRAVLAVILDRYYLSINNKKRFTDDNGEVFVIYTVEEMCEVFGCSKTRINRIFRELESNRLIIRKRKNYISPYRIYLDRIIYEGINCDFANVQNDNSRSYKLKSDESTFCADSNNEYSNNNYNKNKSSINKLKEIEEEIKEQIEYDIICCGKYKNIIDEILMIMVEVFTGTDKTVIIGKEEILREAVISRYLKIDSEHVQYIASSISVNDSKIKNMKSYLRTFLYNIPATYESMIEAEFALHNK